MQKEFLKKKFLLKHVLVFLAKFREEFPYAVNKKVSLQCTPGNCNEKTLDVTSYHTVRRHNQHLYGHCN